LSQFDMRQALLSVAAIAAVVIVLFGLLFEAA
jgi:hypothetical protein